MKVMLLIDSLSNGGAERQLTLLAAGLPQAWQRRVCALGDGPFAARLRDQGVPVSVFPRGSRRDLLPAVGLWRSLLASSPDIVHSWGWMSTMAVGPLCRLAGVPLIDGTVRSGVPETDHPHLRRLGMAFAATIVANSRAGLLASSGARAKGIVVYNGFDWSRVDAAHVTMRADDCPAGGAERPFIVVMTGRMVPVKDFRTVIRAARLLCQGNRAWRFVLIGDGEDRAQLMAEAADLVNEGIVEYPEPDLEVLQHVRRAHAGVLMTDPAYGQEGLSNSIMEYMACALPVVCADSGGCTELVSDGQTGFVIPPRDPVALAARLAWLREHPEMCRTMGAAGRVRVETAFTVSRVVHEYVEFYEEAVSRGGVYS